MKAVILAGGLGTRLSEETHLKPKPMIEIGSKPILWHIMKIFGFYGINDFVICCGYKGYLIKEYFHNYLIHMSDIEINLANNKIEIFKKNVEPWTIKLIDTGEYTMTGGRLKRVANYLNNQAFLFTYGDGVANIDIKSLIQFHQENGKLATVTAVQPPGRYGSLKFGSEGIVSGFQEKPEGDGGWINGGFFVLEPAVIDLITGDDTVWEDKPMKTLANDNNLIAYKHGGFWQPMDTLRDYRYLQRIWEDGNAPWKLW